MKIGIMSDSHDHAKNIKIAIEVFIKNRVDLIIHLGDYVNPASIKLFKGTKLIGIFGNNDGDKYRLMNSFKEIGGEIHGDFYETSIDGMKIACYHGTEPQLKDSLIASGIYDVVLYGHTHECVQEKTGKTLVLNPGTVHGFWERATFMILDTHTGKAEIIEIGTR
jgi:hypothetical protein